MEVEPIRDLNDVKRFYDWLNANYTPREAECFLIGCNVALRAGDLLKIKFSDCEGTHIDLTEKKTGKFRKIPINPTVRAAVARLKEYYSNTKFYKTKELNAEYLFQSTSHRSYHLNQPICIQHLSKVFRHAAVDLDFGININTHTMRKTWGYHAYEKGEDIHYIQAAFNHTMTRITLAYIGVTRSTVEQLYRDNELEIA